MSDVRAPREVRGGDPIDARLGTAPPPGAGRRLGALFRTRAALGLGPIVAPALLFVPIGILLGPQVLNLISIEALGHLDTVVSVALAVLGVFVGTALGMQPGLGGRLFLASTLEAGVTLLVVGMALLYLLVQWGLPVDAPPLIVAVTLGICAAASSAGAPELSDDPAHRTATRIADLDDVLPIVLAGILLPAFAIGPLRNGLTLAGVTCLLGLGIAAAGWLLFERARGTAERGVFVLGTLVMLGGTTAYLSLSPLLAGMVAGLFWTLAPGRADEIIRSDIQRMQHPLVVLLLLTTGATMEVSRVAVWLFAPFLLFRMAGKLAGGWLAARVVSRVAPADLGAYLIPPGVLGIAFALNVHQVSPTPTGAALITAVAAGSLAGELLALFVLPTRTR